MSTITDAITTAWHARQALHDDPELTVYRLFHGYTEGLPGVDIDRFADRVLIAQKGDRIDDAAVIAGALDALDNFSTIAIKTLRARDPNPRYRKLTFLEGDAPASPIEVREAGLRFHTEPFQHENTGFFADARLARDWLRGNATHGQVLNLFAYTGSLGIAALSGGAHRVVHVDQKKRPLTVAQDNQRLNGFACDPRDCLAGDVYYHLPRARRAERRFDGIILDPPPQLPRSKGRKPRGQDYPRLTRLVTPLLDRDAWLMCLFHRYDKTRADSEREVIENSVHPLEVVHRTTSGADFPEADVEAKLKITVFRRVG